MSGEFEARRGDSARVAIELIEKAMGAVTPGRWGQFHPSYAPEAEGTPFSTWDTSNDLSAIKDGKKVGRVATFKHSADAAYVDACNPVAMSAILAEARKANDELAVARSVHRWNVDRYGENLAVCRNEHEKGDPCEWETFVPLARAEAAEDRVAELETALDRAPDGRHFDILAEALAEVKATSDGKSDQSIADIVAGCLDEIAALPPRRARTLLNGGSDAQG